MKNFIIKELLELWRHIEIKDNELYLNGELLEGDYINGAMTNSEDML
ncbi:MAG: hypothetical protein ACLR43_09605 [Faecalibacillus faecis]